MKYLLTAPCHFGLESVLKKEVRNLGYEVASTEDGKVSFYADTAGIPRANIFLRSAERVLIKAAEFHAESWDELFEKTRETAFEEYIPWDGRVWVAKAHSLKSRLFSPRDFQTIIQKAVITRLQSAYGKGPLPMPMTGALFSLRVTAMKDRISVYIDTTGESLHKRGYRTESGRAPISETLAAALLFLTPMRAGRILIDPFSGSGTFPIEAAMMAADIAPGMERNFASCDWHGLIEKDLWHRAYDEARERSLSGMKRMPEEPLITGSDIDPSMTALSKANAHRAGVERFVHFETKDVKDLCHSGRYGIVITNPPYGERMKGEGDTGNLADIYRTLGERVRKLDGFGLYVISAYEGAEKAIGLIPGRNRKVYNGMMKAYFYSYPGPKPPIVRDKDERFPGEKLDGGRNR